MRHLLLSSDVFLIILTAFSVFGLISAAAMGYLLYVHKTWTKASQNKEATR